LATEFSGEAAHLAALLAVGAEGLALGQRFWDWQGCGGGGESEVFQEGSAGEWVVRHWRGYPFDQPWRVWV
jgi:hypothetical protein